MARDIIDVRLLGALHLHVMNRRGFDHDPAVEHAAFQTGTLNSLLEGRFDGDTTIGEICRHGDLGIGTIQALDGEMIIVDGEPFVVDAQGLVTRVHPDTLSPFAVVCTFRPLAERDLSGPLQVGELIDTLGSLLDDPVSLLVVRVEGDFVDLRLRSVHRQKRPYPSLTEVTRHQTEWSIPQARGVLVGFRFPDRLAGVEVPGHHVHFLSDDRRCGGHVLDATLQSGRGAVDGGDELHVELPEGVELGTPGLADRAAIQEAEGG